MLLVAPEDVDIALGEANTIWPADFGAATLALEKFANSRKVELSPSLQQTCRHLGANSSKCAELPFIPLKRGTIISLRNLISLR